LKYGLEAELNARIVNMKTKKILCESCVQKIKATAEAIEGRRVEEEGAGRFSSTARIIFKKKLQNFHAECCRAMSNVSMYRTWKRRISTRAINERLGLPDILTIIGQRNLAWLGKMARMPFTCQIRRLLTGYLDNSTSR